MDTAELDVIHYWSEVKLDIVRDYAAEFTKIINAQRSPALTSVYIDAFAGAGVHVSERTGDFVPGSPLNALWIKPPFREYYFIELDCRRVARLHDLARERDDVRVLEGDCNRLLPESVFPHVRWDQYRRGLCLLDPYGLHLSWEVIAQVAGMKSIELFINFPLADINRNVLGHRPNGVDAAQAARMTRFWETTRGEALHITNERISSATPCLRKPAIQRSPKPSDSACGKWLASATFPSRFP